MTATTFAAQQKARIAEHLDSVTPEQIGACHEVIGPDGKTFYLVENSRGELDENGDLIEYRVSWDREQGYTCTCKAGQYGWARCKAFCWHLRAAVACQMERDGAFSQIATEAATDTEWADEVLGEAPAWVNPENETSHANGTRAHLLISGAQECDDATYSRVVLAKPARKSSGRCYQPKAFSILR